MDYTQLKLLDNDFVAQTYARSPVAICSGLGSVCKDFSGTEYIDFAAGIAVNTLGFCNEDWANAIFKQAKTLSHTSNLYYTEPCAILAKKLCEKTGFKKVFFSNSGAEANECAIKTARKYSSDKYGVERTQIVTLLSSFHGRTITTLSATGQDVFHRNFNPFTPGFVFAKPNDIEQTLKTLSDKTNCAIMLELIQGEGGVNVLEKEYVKEIAKYCKENDLLLIVDEVQTGIGRSGTFLLCEQFEITPDIVTLAKGLGGGLPIGAILFSKTTEKVLGFGDHGSTFGANPIVCAGANVVMDKLDEALLKSVCEKSQYLKNKLLEISEIEAVFGFGLMLGASLKTKKAAQIMAACLRSGLIVLCAKQNLRFLPALTISIEEIDKGVEILKKELLN